MKIVDFDSFNKLLSSTKSKKYKENKAKKIYDTLEENSKLKDFIQIKFMEIFVNKVMKYRNQIIENYELRLEQCKNSRGNSIKNTMELSEEEFREIASRITLMDSVHLSDEDVERAVKSFSILKNIEQDYDSLCLPIMMEYSLYVYRSRYWIRTYLNGGLDVFKKDKNGLYLVDDNYYVKENKDGGKNSPFWISVEGVKNNNSKIKRDIVVKNMFDENKRHTALVAEEIARQLHLPVAQYYPARYIGKKYRLREKIKQNNDNQFVTERIVITPNFLEEKEELITGDRIVGYDMDVLNAPEHITNYLKKQDVDDKEIDKLISEYRIVMMYNCFINHRDCHSGNWGFTKKADGTYKIAHIFDLEGSLTENELHIRAIYAGDRYDDEGILRVLLQDPKVREKAHEFLMLRMEDVYYNIYRSKGFNVEAADKNSINCLIREQKNTLQKILIEIENQDCTEKTMYNYKQIELDNYEEI